MKNTMIWAGLAGAVALAGVAIAQTPDYDNTAQQPAPYAGTPSADTSATDTAATDDTAVNMAGERG